jgi:hypothetical protein
MIPFKPVVETGDEAFISMDPLETLLTSDSLKLVPWMVGLLSSEGGIMTSCKMHSYRKLKIEY